MLLFRVRALSHQPDGHNGSLRLPKLFLTTPPHSHSHASSLLCGVPSAAQMILLQKCFIHLTRLLSPVRYFAARPCLASCNFSHVRKESVGQAILHNKSNIRMVYVLAKQFFSVSLNSKRSDADVFPEAVLYVRVRPS